MWERYNVCGGFGGLTTQLILTRVDATFRQARKERQDHHSDHVQPRSLIAPTQGPPLRQIAHFNVNVNQEARHSFPVRISFH
jgi:hypothetical protein